MELCSVLSLLRTILAKAFYFIAIIKLLDSYKKIAIRDIDIAVNIVRAKALTDSLRLSFYFQ